MAIQQHPLASGSHWRIPTPAQDTARPSRLGVYAGLLGVSDVARAWAERLRERGSMAASTALTLLTLGGVFVAPLATLGALAALLIPGGDIARPLAPPLIVGAVIWLALAILCAHTLRIEEAPRDHER
jgi:fatty acid desaturase